MLTLPIWANSNSGTFESGTVDVRPLGFEPSRFGAAALAPETRSSELSLPSAALQGAADTSNEWWRPRALVDASTGPSLGLQLPCPPGCGPLSLPGTLTTAPSACTTECLDRGGGGTPMSAACRSEYAVHHRANSAATEPPPIASPHDQRSLAAFSEGSTSMGGTIMVAPYTNHATTQSSHDCTAHMLTEISEPSIERGTGEDGLKGSSDPVACSDEFSGPQAVTGGVAHLRNCPLYGGAHLGAMRGLQAGDIGASATDVVLTRGATRSLMRRLDSFSNTDVFLERFEILGREQRRQGGEHDVILYMHVYLNWRLFALVIIASAHATAAECRPSRGSVCSWLS